ncbi:MAG TPA: hypothetical protein VFY04_11785 [Solirubrobacterales bacterium]|nr:hypothetical protein [Solirubrobacterales bacterium]
MSEKRVRWRRAVQLGLDPVTAPGVRAEQLDHAAALVREEVGEEANGSTARALDAFCTALGCLAGLEQWEHGTLEAENDAERHRRAAARRSELVIQGLPDTDVLLAPLREVHDAIVAVDDLGQIAAVRARVATIALPLRQITDQTAGRRTAKVEKEGKQPPAPRAAIVASLDGSPVTAAHVVQPGRVHELSVEARVLDWPTEKPRLTLRFLSRWPRSSVEVTDIALERPQSDEDGVRIAGGQGHLALHASAANPAERLVLTIEGEIEGSGSAETIALLGHPRIEIRTFDPASDIPTGASSLDERIGQMLSELRDEGIAPLEEEAFGRFLAAVARAGTRIEAEREFPRGSRPTEAEFQKAMLVRLGMATELGGRVNEHAWQGGGATDLAHDGVVAELKVERTRPATLERARHYLAQTTQYASAGQRQLSILAILDMTSKDAPPGVLANSLGWLVPKLSGLDHPIYPSKVAVVILNGGLPRPSDWSR